jgi:hypothetical protein
MSFLRRKRKAASVLTQDITKSAASTTPASIESLAAQADVRAKSL